MTTLDDSRLRELALNLLARREHSRAELQFKLAPKVGRDEQLQRLLDQLAVEGLQSDRRFAELYVEARRRRGFGPIRIRAELKARGVAQALIDASLEADDTIWDEVLLAVVRQRFETKTPADLKAWGKRARFLEYRGFSPARIRRLLTKCSAGS